MAQEKTTDTPRPPIPLGAALRRWRALHRVKQAHAADIFGVAQSTISRWESGVQEMETAERRRVEDVLAARLEGPAERALARLIEESRRPVHLVCDISHRLLALSPARAQEFAAGGLELKNQSLWPFITAELAATEAGLEAAGWYDLPVPPAIEAETGANCSAVVPIRPGRCRWTRLLLSDGSAARLVETIA